MTGEFGRVSLPNCRPPNDWNLRNAKRTEAENFCFVHPRHELVRTVKRFDVWLSVMRSSFHAAYYTKKPITMATHPIRLPRFFGATYPGNAPGPCKQRLELFFGGLQKRRGLSCATRDHEPVGCEAGCFATLMRYAAPGLEIVISPRAPHRIAPGGAASCRRTRTPPSRHAKTPALRASRKGVCMVASLPFVFVNNCKVANKCKSCFWTTPKQSCCP